MDEQQSEDEIPMELDLTTSGPPEDNSSSRSSTPHPSIAWCTKYGRVIMPHVGLVLLLATYALAGALLFKIIEQPEEERTRKRIIGDMTRTRQRLTLTLYNLTRFETLEFDMFERITQDIVDGIVQQSYEAYTTQYIRVEELCNSTTEPVVHWDFPNSIFFSLTVITTIGYGTWTPVTQFGRIMCIVFGLFGIPLLLVTIADIGKFLSDLLNFVYRKYRQCVKQVRRTSRRLSVRARRSLSKSPSPDKMQIESEILHGLEDDEEDEYIHLPMIMVMLVLLGYTALGGLLFQYLEDWPYLDAFYYCFITMSTVGFGDMVPVDQKYMLFTLGYIMFGLALTTMCIDLAGTEYIRKIHYLGQKMETAKAAVSNMHMREQLLRSNGYGFMRTAGGKLVAITRNKHGHMMDWTEFDFDDDEDHNILYQPLSPSVQRQVERANIHVMPDELTDKDVGFCVRNKSYARKTRPPQLMISPNRIHTTRRRITGNRKNRRAENQNRVVLVMPFLWKESHV